MAASDGPKAGLLKFQPADRLSINLASSDTARTTITVTNASEAPVAFKVKTTQPKRYLVKPNQGVLEPGASDRIQIQVVPKERQLLLAKAQSASADRFMVQSMTCEARLMALAKDSEELANELTTLWSGSEAAAVAANKFTVSFTGPLGDEGGSTASPAVRAAAASGHLGADRLKELMGGGKAEGGARALSPTVPGSGSGPNMPSSEVLSMRKKYDELVSYTVGLTAERDKLKNELEQVKKEYNKALAARITAEKEQEAGRGGGAQGGKTATVRKPADDGFSLIQMVMVALIAFVAGRYMHT